MPAALRDVAAHAGYITNYNPSAAERLAADLDAAANSLKIFPLRGRPGLVPTTRKLVVVWPYVIVYRVDGQTVEILRVWHGAEDRPS